MGHCCCDGLKTEAEEIIKVCGVGNEKTIPILQEIQKRRGYIPEDLLKEVSEISGVAESRFYGVATFYSQFRFTPLGKYLIKVCNGTACFVSGADILIDTLKELLNVESGETTEDGLFTLETVACLGCCSLAPVVMINDRVYGKQSVDSIRKLIAKIREEDKAAAGEVN